MPIPKPQTDEDKETFISRCMGDDTMNEEYPDDEQRAAICYQSWDDSQKTITQEDIANAEIVELTGEKSKNRKVEYKIFRFQVKSFDEDTGKFTGIASAYRTKPDKYGDIVKKGAFTKTIKDNNGEAMITFPPHDQMSPVGNGIMSDTPKGLSIEGVLVRGVQKAEEAYLLLKAGLIKTLSIGYEAVKWYMENGVRYLTEVKIIEIGLVPGKYLAADDQALITEVKTRKSEEVAADYPWDECMEDQMERYGDEETARRVCGAIRARYGKSKVKDKLDEILPGVEKFLDIEALQKGKTIEPALATQAIEPDAAAVKEVSDSLDSVLSRLQSFDEVKANARLDEILANLGGKK